MPRGPGRPRSNRPTPPVAEDAGDFVPGNVLGSIQQLIRGVVSALPNSSTDFSMERARRHGAYDFSTASEITTAVDWISRMERVFSSLQVPAVRRVSLAVDFLTAEAYRWWESISRDLPDPRAMTWGQFRNHFEDRYLGRAIRDRLRREFMALVQGDMTVMHYEERFLMLSHYAPELVASERDRIDRFIQGLRDEYQDRMLAVEYESFRRAVDAALRCETKALASTRGSRALEVGGPSQGPPKRASSGSGSSSSSGLSSPSSDTRPSFGRHGHGARQRFRQSSSRLSGASSDSPIQVQRTYPLCQSCGRHHEGQCQAGSTVCFQCGQEGHYRRECPQLTDRAASSFDHDTSQASRGASSGGTRASAAGRGTTQEGSAQQGRPMSRARLHAMIQQEDRASQEVSNSLLNSWLTY